MSDDNTGGASKPMTQEQRLALIEKLDNELDDFMKGLKQQTYTDGWPEDKWQEEMAKHPFFMTEAPKPGDELHPLLEGIQQLKYDPNENTAEELANAYKEDGNFNFKYRKYRLAVWAYTEGIKQDHKNDELKAIICNNRAAAQFFLKNYRSCLQDCKNALKYKPDYEKALVRAANCCYEIKKYDDCLEYCAQILACSPTKKEIVDLRQKAILAAKVRDRDVRKTEIKEKKKNQELDDLLKEIKNHGVKLEDHVTKLEQLEPKFPQIANCPVHIDKDTNELIWPVIILYPEFKTMDVIQEFRENVKIIAQLSIILSEGLIWDDCNKYTLENINVYYEQKSVRKLHLVDVNLTLGVLLQQPTYVVSGGTPSLIVLARTSPAELHFLSNYKS